MTNLRKFIVKNYAGYYRMKIFKKWATALKCTRIMFPYFLIMGGIFCIPPTESIQWYEIILLIGFAFQTWLTFDWFGLGYFKLFPVNFNELDEFNQFLYGIDFPEKLTEEQKKYHQNILIPKFLQ